MAEEKQRRRRRRRKPNQPQSQHQSESRQPQSQSRQKKRLPRAYVLIGMPGSGKSALGRRVAKLLGWSFVDTDDILAERAGMTVGELSASASNEEFRRLEEEAVLTLKREQQIIATGGSVVYGKQAMHHLQNIATIIYLDHPLWMIIRRLGDTTEKRGVILKPGQKIDDIFHERKHLYRKYADIEFQTKKLSPGKSSRILANIIRFLEEEIDETVETAAAPNKEGQSHSKSRTSSHVSERNTNNSAAQSPQRRRRRRRSGDKKAQESSASHPDRGAL